MEKDSHDRRCGRPAWPRPKGFENTCTSTVRLPPAYNHSVSVAGVNVHGVHQVVFLVYATHKKKCKKCTQKFTKYTKNAKKNAKMGLLKYNLIFEPCRPMTHIYRTGHVHQSWDDLMVPSLPCCHTQAILPASLCRSAIPFHG